ncbi:MAG: hypothetical protein JW804_05075 [Sedimentisphaerales bacterium]|nr:hypothetical protein [Sedimentisphaerales bacterium]
MLTKPLQIVIDKESLVGVNIDKLCNLAENHYLLACDTLLYECATTSESKRGKILNRYKKIMEAGAYHCSCSVGFLQYEGKHGSPYPRFLPDLDATEKIRRARLKDLLGPNTINKVYQSRCDVAKKIFLELSEKLKIRLGSENPEVGKAMRDLPSDPLTRFQKLTERIDLIDLHQMGVDLVPKDWIRNDTQFCLSPDWISWQYIRLTNIIVMNYYYLHQMGGPPGDNRAEHDYQDMEYVLLLSRADALLTRDKKLVEPLAKAAFPEKDVFSSIDEIPDSYKIS